MTLIARGTLPLLLCFAVGCGTEELPADDRNDSFLLNAGKADGLADIAEGSSEAIAVLAVVNQLSVGELDHSDRVGLDKRAAEGIVSRRSGLDGIDGTSDDTPFTTLVELDAVPFVGPAAFSRLLDYALASEFFVSHVNMSFVGVVVAPATASGEQWDIEASVDDKLMSSLTEMLLGSNPFADVVGLLTGPAVSSLSRPDPIGSATILLNGVDMGSLTLATDGNNTEDTFIANWPDNPGIDGIPLDAAVRIRVHVQDADLFLDDDIATVELNNQDLQEALAHGGVYPVQVASQSFEQLLFVQISVSAAN